jgi:hypothetical protein
MPRQAEQPKELLVWTDIDPAHEADFNKWYDREHMDERVAIPGFAFARRFLRIGPGRKYLALYRTESLAVFDSAPYRRAFDNQTQWSLDNFKRMRDAVRCVGTVAQEAGAGSGGVLGIVELSADRAADAGAQLEQAVSQDGMISGYLLVPDARLSKPLPGAAITALGGPALVLEGTNPASVAITLQLAARALGADPARCATFQLMWRLDRSFLTDIQQ